MIVKYRFDETLSSKTLWANIVAAMEKKNLNHFSCENNIVGMSLVALRHSKNQTFNRAYSSANVNSGTCFWIIFIRPSLFVQNSTCSLFCFLLTRQICQSAFAGEASQASRQFEVAAEHCWEAGRWLQIWFSPFDSHAVVALIVLCESVSRPRVCLRVCVC